MFDKMTHANVKPANGDFHAKHPFRNDKNHEKLLEYIKQRLLQGKQARDGRLERLAQIDRNVAGWQKLTPEDKQRLRKKQTEGTPTAVTMNLPIAFIHLDDMMTYFTQTFAPNRGMFFHTGKPDEVTPANQIVTLMNNHAIHAGYFRQVLLTVYGILKYNVGGFHAFWARDYGPKLSKDNQNQDVLTDDLKWEGNRVNSLDMYNTMWDPAVHPTDLHHAAEWASITTMRSHYWLADKASKGVYFNVKDILEDSNGITQCAYYRHPPQAARMDQDEGGIDTGMDYSSWFGAPDYAEGQGFELTEIYIRINPNDFDLLDLSAKDKALRNRYEVWRFTVLNDTQIIDATFMNNIHGHIPFYMGVINDDLMGQSQKSVAEVIQPLQDFASFLLNIHVLANRKNVWGTTYYDPTMVDLSKIPEGSVAARVPVEPAAFGKDIRTYIFNEQKSLDTKQTLGDLQGIMDIVNQFFPTQSLPSQIASIDRAVDSQVAAVQQGANRRMHKTARLLDDTLFRNMRFGMYYNIIQFQPDNVSVNDFYGKEVKIDLNALRNTDLPFIIGQGLKSLDRAAAAQALQQIIFALIQNPIAAQRIDMIALIDYWTSMIDVDVDMTKFHLQQNVPTQTGNISGDPVPAQEAAGVPTEVAQGAA